MGFLLRNWHLKLSAVALSTVLYTGLVFSGDRRIDKPGQATAEVLAALVIVSLGRRDFTAAEMTQRLLEPIDAQARCCRIIDAWRKCPDGHFHQLVDEERHILRTGSFAPDDEHVVERLVVPVHLARCGRHGQQHASPSHKGARPGVHAHHEVVLACDVDALDGVTFAVDAGCRAALGR